MTVAKIFFFFFFNINLLFLDKVFFVKVDHLILINSKWTIVKEHRKKNTIETISHDRLWK